MKAVTYEATVQNGQIKLRDTVRLPEQTKVYVVVPDVEESPVIHVHSPRLAHPEQAPEFIKEVSTDA
jgi:hypothetical protein